jgi:hypothetical protein
MLRETKAMFSERARRQSVMLAHELVGSPGVTYAATNLLATRMPRRAGRGLQFSDGCRPSPFWSSALLNCSRTIARSGASRKASRYSEIAASKSRF